tara:strand:- start:18 stop:563 length:546 start_codon:yes stop_codon:yes gene_type:complete
MFDPERLSKDRMATSIALGRPMGLAEGFNYTAPNIGMGSTKATDKETIEEYNARTGATIPDSQLIKDDSGMVIGIRDESGNLIEGIDPNAQQRDDGGSGEKRVAKKAPTDPCPEGYQLIDGKCTLMEKPVDEGTGFIRFPTDRDPPFKKGPFSPTTVATPATGIRALNPITFTLPPNPFKT